MRFERRLFFCTFNGGRFRHRKYSIMFENRLPEIETTRSLRIKPLMIAKCATVPRQRVHDFLTQQNLPETQENRIAEAIKKIATIWQMTGFEIGIDSPEKLEVAYDNSRRIQSDIEELHTLQSELRSTLGELQAELNLQREIRMDLEAALTTILETNNYFPT